MNFLETEKAAGAVTPNGLKNESHSVVRVSDNTAKSPSRATSELADLFAKHQKLVAELQAIVDSEDTAEAALLAFGDEELLRLEAEICATAAVTAQDAYRKIVALVPEIVAYLDPSIAPLRDEIDAAIHGEG